MKISFDDDREDIIIGKKTEVKKDDKEIKVPKKTTSPKKGNAGKTKKGK